CLQSTYWPFTF
nr:immunoglobulin light chain junction region [Macaca mulatta]MOX51880.1 immunoglobulin light chain junction region [Macaca mulatta]MOX53666.1 immunoglobulin light chain junction region [Macaca mulatta]MOX55940.1 immunoglobulin light chain junction region [Macaca mulatta]